MEMLGLYPVFYVPNIGTAWLMGLTGVIHVLFSHTSVGASILFAFLAYKAYHEDRPELYHYMKKYGMFLLIFSYVMGSITGPGIWYTATVASPRGISALIHNFVWVWATEWVFFIYEVVGVFALVYFMDKIDRKTHLKLTYTFALASVGTLALIVGIISFMMWPGNDAYYNTGSVSDAFFGINTFPHMFLRIGFMIMMSGVIGMVISSAMKKENPALSVEMTQKMGIVSMIGGFITMLFFMWYILALPENAHALMGKLLPGIIMNRIILTVLFTVYFAAAIFRPKWISKSLASVMVLVILMAGLWPGEKLRESLRKPYIAGHYMYSNQIIGMDVPGKGIKNEVPLLAAKGYLKLDPWVPTRLRTITPENKLEVGKMLAIRACSNCHSLEKDGVYRPIVVSIRIANLKDAESIKGYMKNVIGTGSIPYMPKIALPDDEYDAIATYLDVQANK